MKCIVTGGAGYSGTCLVGKLRQHGHEVAVLDRRRPAFDVEWLPADIRDADRLRFRGVDAVFHRAAVADARLVGEDPSLCYETNVLGTLHVVRAAHRDGVGRVLLASSAWVTSAQAGDAVSERSLFDPGRINTLYGASKLMQEIVCLSHRAETGGPDCTIFRYGTSYGEGMWNGLVVRAFMASAESRGVIPIMGDGRQYREFLYLGDLCDAQVLALADIGRQLYVEAMQAYQEPWLQQRRQQYQAVRWRRVDCVTPLGLIALPTRVIRERGARRGGYRSLGKRLLRGKATRLLSPAVEQNYRPAARRIMAGVWRSDSEAVLEALRQAEGGLGRIQPKQFRELFGSILGNRDGLDAYRPLPAVLRREGGRGKRRRCERAAAGGVAVRVEAGLLDRHESPSGLSRN